MGVDRLGWMRRCDRIPGMTTELIPVAGGSHIWAEKAGDGPPLVLLHGSVHDSRLWNRVFAVLARPPHSGSFRRQGSWTLDASDRAVSL
jgi:pimeloyl-ACP methyl ester carboxylesterase